MNYVFDACALLSYLHDEPGSDVIDELLKKTTDGKTAIYMNIVNLIEAHYVNVRNLGADKATVILEKILAAPIQIVSVVSDTIF
jgi:predicted nucleic acid-binding protein